MHHVKLLKQNLNIYATCSLSANSDCSQQGSLVRLSIEETAPYYSGIHRNNVCVDENVNYFRWRKSWMKGRSLRCTFSWELLKLPALMAWVLTVLCIRQSICFVCFVLWVFTLLESKYFEWLCVNLLWIMTEDFYILRLQIVTCISFWFLLQVGNTTVICCIRSSCVHFL